MYGIIALGLYLVFALIRLPIERAAKARKQQSAAAQAAAQAADPEDDQPFGGAGDDRYGRPLCRATPAFASRTPSLIALH